MRRIVFTSLLGILLLSLAFPVVSGAQPVTGFVVQSLNPPAPPNDYSALYGISCPGIGSCVAVGVTTPSGTEAALAATLNGGTWTLSSITNSAITAPSLRGVWCASTVACVAVGSVNTGGTTQAPLIETLVGSTWTPTTAGLLPSGAVTGSLNAVSCSTEDYCTATGTYGTGTSDHVLVETLPGTNTWTASSVNGPAGTVYASLSGIQCSNPTSCLGVGLWASSATTEYPLLESLSGSTWTPSTLGDPGDGLTSISCLQPTSCLAVGNTAVAGGAAVAESLSGTTWTRSLVPVPAGANAIDLSGVSCDPSDSSCVAVGTYRLPAPQNTVPHALVDVFTGGTWTATTGIDPSTGNVTPSAVTCPTTEATCIGVGSIIEGAGPQNAVAIYPQSGSPGCLVCPGQTFPARGYSMVASDGGIFSYGDATFYGSTSGMRLNAPVVGMATTFDGGGYWLVASDGGIFSYGDATFYGSTGGMHLNAPIVGMAATADGNGYWLVAADGGIFSYGDATFHGSTGGMHLNAPIVGMAATPDGGGYWLVASDGGIFSYGDATFHGSTGGMHLNAPIVGMAATPDGGGYWLVATDGGIFSYGDATFLGSTGSMHLNAPIVGMASSDTGNGYWLVGSDGGIFSYGDAGFFGSAGSLPLNRPVVGIVASPPRLP